eukprot:TRINITY_DN2761_c0_g1_i1.p1 TRINITY_DN2761_c0_g1~~TRINITY_DN2761_c0_g1_i1.p1  ORF type:complete len:454 (+),score=103.78 TRINITY_DN2761_c0_g1_i1:71-1363(+)
MESERDKVKPGVSSGAPLKKTSAPIPSKVISKAPVKAVKKEGTEGETEINELWKKLESISSKQAVKKVIPAKAPGSRVSSRPTSKAGSRANSRPTSRAGSRVASRQNSRASSPTINKRNSIVLKSAPSTEPTPSKSASKPPAKAVIVPSKSSTLARANAIASKLAASNAPTKSVPRVGSIIQEKKVQHIKSIFENVPTNDKPASVDHPTSPKSTVSPNQHISTSEVGTAAVSASLPMPSLPRSIEVTSLENQQLRLQVELLQLELSMKEKELLLVHNTPSLFDRGVTSSTDAGTNQTSSQETTSATRQMFLHKLAMMRLKVVAIEEAALKKMQAANHTAFGYVYNTKTNMDSLIVAAEESNRKKDLALNAIGLIDATFHYLEMQKAQRPQPSNTPEFSELLKQGPVKLLNEKDASLLVSDAITSAKPAPP